jgi:kynureninase
MGPDFHPIQGAEGWQLSNPPILSLAAIRASMEIFDEVGMERLCQKSEQLTGYLEFLIKEKTHGCVRVITPADPVQRGCQLSLVVPGNGKDVYKSLTEGGVVCDWREPDVIRVAPVPLYNSFQDVYQFVEVLTEVVM